MLHGYAETDPFTGLVLSSLTGWRGLPGARSWSDSIPGGHGSYQRRQLFREGRSMELRGGVVAESEEAAALLLDEFEAAVGNGYVEMRVSDATGVWSRTVEVLNLTPAERWNADRFGFTLDLFADDPLRYRDAVLLGPVGLPVKRGGLRLPQAFPWNFGDGRELSRISVENTGSAPMFPRVIVDGGFSSLIVRDITAGRTFEYASPVPAGKRLVIDSRHSVATIDGRAVTRNATRREWFEIDKTSTHIFDFRVTDPVSTPQMWVEQKIGAW